METDRNRADFRGRESPGPGARPDRDRADRGPSRVSKDMEAIFGKAADPPPPSPKAERPRARPIVIRNLSSAGRGGTSWRLVAAAVLAAMVGTFITVMRDDRSGPPPRLAAGAPARNQPSPSRPPAAVPADRLAEAAPAPPVPQRARAIPAERKAESQPRPKPESGPARLATADKSRTAPTRLASRPSRQRCEGMNENREAWCLRPAVLAADRGLRDAYADAIRTGVERSTLISYRKRWARLRNRSSDEPRYLIGSYRALAEELASLSDQARMGR